MGEKLTADFGAFFGVLLDLIEANPKFHAERAQRDGNEGQTE